MDKTSQSYEDEIMLSKSQLGHPSFPYLRKTVFFVNQEVSVFPTVGFVRCLLAYVSSTSYGKKHFVFG